jgi:hypothetical protein
MRTEKEYLIKIVDYKGKTVGKLKYPKSKKEKFDLIVNLLRLYERAKKYGFLTKSLFLAIKKLALASKEAGFHLSLFRYPVLIKHFNEILKLEPENLEEEIVYGKVREHEHERCHVCGIELVYPAYIVFKKNGKEVKKSESIGIKCLNHLEENILNLVEEIEINNNLLEKTFKEVANA